MPDTGASRKRQIARRQIPGGLAVKITGLSGRPGYSGLQNRFSNRIPKRQPFRRRYRLNTGAAGAVSITRA